MSSWNKDPETGKPNFIPENKRDNVTLYTVADLDETAAQRGIKSPGWVFYSEHERADGHTARRIETLVSFRGAHTMGPEEPVEDVAPSIVTATQVAPAQPEPGQTVTITPATFSGSPTPTRSVTATLNGSTVIVTNNQFVAQEGNYVVSTLGQNRAGNATSNVSFTVSAEQTDEPLDLSARVLFNGHSLIDAIFSGSADTRQTFLPFREDPNLSVRWTIPGSPMSSRWNRRFGADFATEPAPDAPAWNPNDAYNTVLPGRDMSHFDAMVITEGGPFAPPPNANGGNDGFFASQEMFDNWLNLCKANNTKMYFWTIWPALRGSPWDAYPVGYEDTDLPIYKAWLDIYNKTAESWCGKEGITIIPGHRLFWELYDLAEANAIPGITDFEDLFSDDIHTNHLSSIFCGTMMHRYLFGEFPATAEIQAMLDEGSYQVTPQFIIDTINTVIADYTQGPGVVIDLEFEPVDTLFNFELPLSTQGMTNVGPNTPAVLAGVPLADGVWAWKETEAPVTEFYMVAEVEFAEGAVGSDTKFGMTNFQSNAAGAYNRAIGMFYNSWTNVLNAGYDATGYMQGYLLRQEPDHPWTSATRVKLEIIVTGNTIRMRNLEPGAWSDTPPTTIENYPTGLNTFTVNMSFEDQVPASSSSGFIIHKGIVLDHIPDDATRFNYQAWINGGFIT